jgi:hypothetical protein
MQKLELHPHPVPMAPGARDQRSRGANDIRKKATAVLPDLMDHRQHRDPGEGATRRFSAIGGSCGGAAPPAKETTIRDLIREPACRRPRCRPSQPGNGEDFCPQIGSRGE